MVQACRNWGGELGGHQIFAEAPQPLLLIDDDSEKKA